MMSVPVVLVEKVSKEYKRGKEVVVALKDINMEVRESDFLLIVGIIYK